MHQMTIDAMADTSDELNLLDASIITKSQQQTGGIRHSNSAHVCWMKNGVRQHQGLCWKSTGN